MHVDLRCLHGLVSEPQRDDCSIHAVLKQVHRRGVTQDVRAYALSIQRRARLGSRQCVFSDDVLHGIAAQAVGLTFGVLFVMLVAYKTGIVRATERFRVGVIAATGGIAVFYLVVMVLGLFHVNVGAGVLYGHGPWSIAFSLFVVAIAALNLVLDFDMIETGVRIGAPKYMEWYGAFGLMVTLIWLYLEILRLLANSRRR